MCHYRERPLSERCVVRTFVHACWLLRHFNDQCEGPLQSTLGVLFLFCYDIFYNVRSHKNATTDV